MYVCHWTYYYDNKLVMFSVFISLDVLCNVTMYTVTVYQMLYEKVTS